MYLEIGQIKTPVVSMLYDICIKNSKRNNISCDFFFYKIYFFRELRPHILTIGNPEFLHQEGILIIQGSVGV